MVTTTRPGEKRTAVEYLDFPARTSNRVGWESWSFRLVGPYQVEVCNESYGFLKNEHTYVVGVEERDSVVIPAECECPADVHHDPDCKHKVALATVGGPTVLNAAVAYENPVSEADTKPAEATCPNGDPRCDGPTSDDLPCFACFSP